MKLKVDDITALPKNLEYAEGAAEMNARLAGGAGDYRMADDVRVSVAYYRAGLDVYLSGTLEGSITGVCARCTEEFHFPLTTELRLVLAPRSTDARGGGALAAEDLSLSFFEGKEIDLTPLVHEQVLLALPTRPLCREECRGLCPGCGADLNTEACRCVVTGTKTRLAVLPELVRGK